MIDVLFVLYVGKTCEISWGKRNLLYLGSVESKIINILLVEYMLYVLYAVKFNKFKCYVLIAYFKCIS